MSRDRSPERGDLELSRLKALFNVAIEILHRCGPQLVVTEIALKEGKANLEYYLGYFTDFAAFLDMLTFTSDGMMHKMPGFSWAKLQRLLELGVSMTAIKRKLENLQVAAGKFEATHSTLFLQPDWMSVAPDRVKVAGEMTGQVCIKGPDATLVSLLLQNSLLASQEDYQYYRLARVLFPRSDAYKLCAHKPDVGRFGYCVSGQAYRAVVFYEQVWALAYYRSDTNELLVANLTVTEFPQLKPTAWWTHFGLCASAPPLAQLERALEKGPSSYLPLLDSANLSDFWDELLSLVEPCAPSAE